MTGNDKFTETPRLVVAVGLEVAVNGGEVSFWGEGQVLEVDGGGGCTTLYLHSEPLAVIILIGKYHDT